MKAEQKIMKSDLERANDALTELKSSVTAADRKECGYSEPTVVQYLNGQGTQLGTAVELLKFFRERIEQRRKFIASA